MYRSHVSLPLRTCLTLRTGSGEGAGVRNGRQGAVKDRRLDVLRQQAVEHVLRGLAAVARDLGQRAALLALLLAAGIEAATAAPAAAVELALVLLQLLGNVLHLLADVIPVLRGPSPPG